jgi:hypothetical protein
MIRLLLGATAVAPTCAVILAAVLAAGSGGGGNDHDLGKSTPSQAGKIAPSLAARLAQLPATEPVRLIVGLVPGTPTEAIGEEIERLGGRLIQRFQIIEAVVVIMPRAGVEPLARLQRVRSLELADSGEPPPAPS